MSLLELLVFNAAFLGVLTCLAWVIFLPIRIFMPKRQESEFADPIRQPSCYAPSMPANAETLSKLHPDPEVRHSLHYHFACDFLPAYIHKNARSFFTAMFATDTPDSETYLQSLWCLMESSHDLGKPKKW